MCRALCGWVYPCQFCRCCCRCCYHRCCCCRCHCCCCCCCRCFHSAPTKYLQFYAESIISQHSLTNSSNDSLLPVSIRVQVSLVMKNLTSCVQHTLAKIIKSKNKMQQHTEYHYEFSPVTALQYRFNVLQLLA